MTQAVHPFSVTQAVHPFSHPFSFNQLGAHRDSSLALRMSKTNGSPPESAVFRARARLG